MTRSNWGRHSKRLNRAVGAKVQRHHADPALVDAGSLHVIEEVPVPAKLRHRALDVARIVVEDGPLVLEGTEHLLADTVFQLRGVGAVEAGIGQVVKSVPLVHPDALVKLREGYGQNRPVAGDHVLLHLHDPQLVLPVEEIGLAVVVDENVGIDGECATFVSRDERFAESVFEGTFRLVGYRDADLLVGGKVEVVLPVAP